MRALVQRVSRASVRVGDKLSGATGKGLLILLGVTGADSERESERLALKVSKLRIFNDEHGKMNKSVLDVGGAALVVSQFTLYADARKGNRPSYVGAAAPEQATALYEHFSECLRGAGLRVANGVFGATMDVELLNQGPVTIWLDTAELFAGKD